MKFFTHIFFTIAALFCAITFGSSATTAYANDIEIIDVNDNFANDTTTFSSMVYDLNKDEVFTIADLVLTKAALEDGTLAEKDFWNVCNLLLGYEVEVEVEEYNLDDIQVTPEIIDWVTAQTASYCVDRYFDDTIGRITFLNDGKVTVVYSEKISAVNEIISMVSEGSYITIFGINSENHLCIENFAEMDLDDLSIEFAIEQLAEVGEFDHFVVMENGTTVRFYFRNNFSIKELRLSRIDEIEIPIETFTYNGTFITIGITADGKLALDTYSFDIAPIN